MTPTEELEYLNAELRKSFEEADSSILETIIHPEFDFHEGYEVAFQPNKKSYLKAGTNLSPKDWYIKISKEVIMDVQRWTFRNVRTIVNPPELVFIAEYAQVDTETGNHGEYITLMNYMEVKDGKIYRMTVMTDLLSQFLRWGLATLTTDEQTKLQNYLNELREKGLLDDEDAE